MKVYGGEICGSRKEGTTFVATGTARGHYPLYVCDKEPHASGQHHDSQVGKTW